ncbi:hypothetical protein UFOVP1165_34 [uncultured Caudovirales phage]|jgi:hypothetical protein|uniref:Uncharacterized protein n=1 Tax=uncultured Caudovirales phage TaxID=2100421 RepID=A0A6J5R3K5_9CAUD|nr:hypothetical protein UFOVP1165_34 [uncultured Caudovirales phage]
MSYDNDNKGAVWKNLKREKDTHPHWTGSAMINGVDYWVNAWKKADDANEKAPSIKFSFTAKEKREESHPVAQNHGPDFDDDIPF